MVTEMLMYIKGVRLSRAEIEGLLAGITVDTKNFAFKTGIKTFEAAAFLKKNGAENRNFGQISGHLPGFCPLLNPHFDHEKPSIYAGLRAFCPLSHFFL